MITLRNCSGNRAALVAPLVLIAITIIFLTNVFALGDLGVVVEKAEGGVGDRCKYCGKPVRPGNIHKDAQTLVTNQVKNRLTERDTGFVDGPRKKGYINVLIYRFEERQGGNFAVDKPASVGFHMHLMEENGTRKTFVFDEVQESLTTNVLNIGKFFKRGAKWVTVETLSDEGVNAGIDYLLQGLE